MPPQKTELCGPKYCGIRRWLSSLRGFSEKQIADYCLCTSQIGELFQQRELVIERFIEHLLRNVIMGIPIQFIQRLCDGGIDNLKVAIKCVPHLRAPSRLV